MSILTKALDKIHNNDDKTDAKRTEVRLPLSAKGYGMASSLKDGNNNETKHQPDFEIDVRLDQDLTDYVKQSKHSRFKEAELDLDLTNPSSEELSFIESQILKINPTRSFSHQIEVSLKKLDDAGFVTPNNDNSILSNTYRALKRPVLNNVMGKGATVWDNANLIMLTSSFEGEGKTFSALNMAMSIAMERDKRVLLIDADVNKPSHHKYFGQEMKQGLTDLLLERVDDMSKVIYKTDIPSLSLMFAGKRATHATELFASKAMENFVNELSARYDDRIIIFDSAPLLLPTEAGVLASHMGQIILVVEAEHT
jgi:exopolysaccharide/PEP-CTERM locus tyrosine autokinase